MPFKEVTRWVKLSADAKSFKERIPQQKIYRMSVGKNDICLTRYEEKVYAFENKCPHQMVSLLNGHCSDDKMVICPWHRFAFSLEDGKGCGLYLPVFPIKEEDNAIYIGFKKTVFSFFKS